MRSEGFFTYSRGAYTNFLHEERKMRRLFFARRAYSTHFTRRVMKILVKYFDIFHLKFQTDTQPFVQLQIVDLAADGQITTKYGVFQSIEE